MEDFDYFNSDNSFVKKFVMYFFVCFLTIALILVAVSKYPETAVGDVIIKTKNPTLRYNNNINGKIYFLLKTEQVVNGQVVAMIGDSVDLQQLKHLKKLLKNIDLELLDEHVLDLPVKISLGQITQAYFQFYILMKRHSIFKTHNISESNMKIAINELNHDKVLLQQRDQIFNIEQEKGKILQNFSSTDSLLYIGEAISKHSLDLNRINRLDYELEHEFNNLSNFEIKKRIEVSKNKIDLIKSQYYSEKSLLKADLIKSYWELWETIRLWELRHLIVSRVNGSLEYLKPLYEGMHLQAEEELCAISPNSADYDVYLNIKDSRIGKIERGQKVMINLNNFSSKEFGYIEGVITKTPKIFSNNTDKISTLKDYLFEVRLINGLKTKYGVDLSGRESELLGSAQVVIDNSTFFSRIFNNFKYIYTMNQE